MNLNKNYPLYEVVKFNNFREMLDMAAEAAGDKNAFIYRKDGIIETATYNKFNYTTKALGSALTAMGFGEEHIAMTGENSYEWLTVYLTVLAGKGVFVPIDQGLPFSEIVHILGSSESKIVFYSDKFEQQMHENRDKLPEIKYFVNVSKSILDEKDEFISMQGLIEKGKQLLKQGNTDYLEPETDDSKLKMLVYTSGTTGTSKGVMLSLHNLVSGVYYGMQVSTVYERCLSVLPYHHTYEAVCDILVSLHHHSTICINESLRAVMNNLKDYKPDYIMLVPLFVENFYKRIWKAVEEKGKADSLRTLIKVSNGLRRVGIDKRKTFFKAITDNFGGNLRKIVAGGAPIRAELADFFDAVGIDLINGYGITECSPLVSANRDYFNNFESVGVLLPCVECKIDDPNEDGEGEICVRGDIVMMGYYKAPEATAAVFEEDGWFHTGDYGKMNDKDQLFITGRKKNLIVLNNGKNVYPEEIEEYLKSISIISEVVVFSNRNENGAEVSLGAEIYLDEDAVKGLDKDQRKAKVKEEITKLNKTLPGYKNIATIRIRTKEFEKTTSKKIRRTDLGENLEED